MLSLFVSDSLVSLCNFGVALSVSNSGHCKVHTNLCALAHEVLVETVDDLLVVNFLSDADNVLAGKLQSVIGSNLSELGSGSSALGTFFGCGLTLIYIAADRTYKLFHIFYLRNIIIIIFIRFGIGFLAVI